MISQLWPIRLYLSFGCSFSRNSARSTVFHGSGEPAAVSVADGLGCPAVLEVRERDRINGRAALVPECDAAAELDDPVVADVDAVMVVVGRAPYVQMVAGLKSAVHAETLPEGVGPGLSRNA